MTFVTMGFSQTMVQSEFVILEETQISVHDNFNITATGKVVNDGILILKSNLVNNGQLSYTPLNTFGAVHFTGADQQISGGQTTVCYNVLFNNNSTALMGAVQIDNDADFTNGIVSNRNHGGSIIFNDLADHINTSNASFVDGTVLRKGKLDFVFPVGALNSYRAISIIGLTTTNSFTSTYFQKNSTIKYPHNQKEDVIKFIDQNEYWQLKQTKGKDFAIIELARDATTSSGEIRNAKLKNLHIVRWDSVKNSWIDEGGTVNPINNTIQTITKVSENGIYTLAIVMDKIAPKEEVVDVASAITPNGDGKNDFWVIPKIHNYPNNKVFIYTADGQKVFSAAPYRNDWQGTQDGTLLLQGSYLYIVHLGNNKVPLMGWLFINY